MGFFAAKKVSAAAIVALLVGASVACSSKKEAGASSSGSADGKVSIAPQGKVLEAAENEDKDGGARAAFAGGRAKAREAKEIPAGHFTAGSTPGDRGRDPSLEPAELGVDLGAFSIDALPYPNDPSKPALTGVSRARAAEVCEQAGARLCTELEWERACKGAEGSTFATGNAWDAACAKDPSSCASSFGVFGMGALREWTASDVAPIENAQNKAAAVRGARADANAVDHRCAHRAAVDPNVTADDLGFRCCHGAPNAASIPSPSWQQTFRKVDLSPAQLADMFSSAPQLKDLQGISYFKEPDDVNLVLKAGDAGAGPPNTSFTTQPLLWNPVPGEEVLVAAGKAQNSSFIVAFYRLPGDRYRIASSFVMKNEKGPVVLGFNGYVRKKIGWGIGWDVPGESGFITYRDDNRVVITQK